MESIGIVDFDFLSTKKLCNYNFGVLLVSSYYLKQGLKIRLILELSHENLMKYDKIYMFKDYKTKIKPINLIKDYYSLPVEEYGEGFDNRPLLPNLPDLIYTPIKTDHTGICIQYNRDPLLLNLCFYFFYKFQISITHLGKIWSDRKYHPIFMFPHTLSIIHFFPPSPTSRHIHNAPTSRTYPPAAPASPRTQTAPDTSRPAPASRSRS